MKHLLLVVFVFTVLCGLMIGGALLAGRQALGSILLTDELNVRESYRIYLWDTLRDVHHPLPPSCRIPISGGGFGGTYDRRFRWVTSRDFETLLRC